jgi:hypothetical protein
MLVPSRLSLEALLFSQTLIIQPKVSQNLSLKYSPQFSYTLCFLVLLTNFTAPVLHSLGLSVCLSVCLLEIPCSETFYFNLALN